MQDELIGMCLGNYQILSPLGQGGMARVYRAQDTALKRMVAVKVISPGLSDQEKYRERFEREAQSVAALDHPNIVPVYYFGKTKGLYYLVMKFIEGEDLAYLIHRYAKDGEYLPFNDIERIVTEIASALDYAHSKGVVHRDVKPSNIVIDSEGHPYLTDFGLALNLGQATVGDALGTPHYMAPEQVRSSANAVPQSDFYALGIILYELLVGVVPFDGPNPTSVALQHVINEPPAPRNLNPSLSPQVETVVLKAMAKKPEDRYRTGAQLAHALHSALQASDDATRRSTLPPLPPGVQPPLVRKPSGRSVANTVRLSLGQSPILATSDTPVFAPSTQPRSSEDKRRSTRPSRHFSHFLKAILFLVLVGFIIVLIVIVGLLNGPTPPSPTPMLTQTVILSTNTPVFLIQDQIVVETAQPDVSPAPVISPSPPTLPLFSGPTAAPSDWLSVQLIYDNSSIWWFNPSDWNLRAERIAFERIGGAGRFSGERWSLFSSTLYRHSCMRLIAADAKVGIPRPSDCRDINADIRGKNDEDFWTGETGQFRVLWNDIEVAVCDIAPGECWIPLPAG